jgi:hypothetical protein
MSGGVGCSLTATRPIQEMANAEIAIKAAKDLNADSLVPEIYRAAVDTYFKAKRDFRLKNFDASKKYALRAMRLAEQAEFEAYRMGGATPEATNKFTAPEGSLPDPTGEFSQPAPTGEAPPPPSVEPPKKKEEAAPEEKGKDYNDVLKEQEEEKKKQEEDAKKEQKPPGGPTGPRPMGPTGKGPTLPPQPAVPSSVGPFTGGVPGAGAGVPSNMVDQKDYKSPDTITRTPDPYMNLISPTKEHKGYEMDNMPDGGLKDISETEADFQFKDLKELDEVKGPVKITIPSMKVEEINSPMQDTFDQSALQPEKPAKEPAPAKDEEDE